MAQAFHVRAGGYAQHNAVEPVVRDGDDWLVTMRLAPHRTVRLEGAREGTLTPPGGRGVDGW